MLKKTLLLALTMCAAATLAISQPAYAQVREFKNTPPNYCLLSSASDID